MKHQYILRLCAAIGLTLSLGVVMAAEVTLPPIQQSGAVKYLSGGIGLEQSLAIKDAMHNYPLVLTFVGRTANNGNEYLSDIPVTISDSRGNMILTTQSDGPFMLASLPDGRYTVTASYEGVMEKHAVNVSSRAHAHQTFLWSR
ncbi:carboxypeptidase regulatory-like domain-containing protein [Pandoraea horticolens]|uniref:Carboxypeptidase regulatory-like domain-containing protein n=1 Tax=Pandoraea horticolens TaxID=2508298 RepID=A0A5E4WEW7_9BURK|nr:carboxypeptidase-like regulatory domain-containing protein [Pandoraea horticolens]VVE22971.1 carboxypeptidase regulatory-like domain-containing protein [Pandoraea horticolens]